MRVAKLTAIVFPALFPGVLAAQDDSLAMLESCTPIVTVHREACFLSPIYDCNGEYRVLFYKNDELIDMLSFGPEWDFRGYRSGDGRMRLDFPPDSGPGLSLADLWAKGEDAGARDGLLNTNVFKDQKLSVEATYSLSDEAVTLSGVTFRKGTATRTLITNPANRNLDAVFAFETFVSLDPPLFIFGDQQNTMNNRTEEIEATPVELAFPGDDGFQAKISKHGCN